MSWDPLTEADRLRISAVVHQGYSMPDVFETVAQIVREHHRSHELGSSDSMVRLTATQVVDLQRWLKAALGDGVSLRQEAANEARRILVALTTVNSEPTPVIRHDEVGA